MSITVSIVNSRAEAELIAGMLRHHGIQARVSADDLGGVDMALQAQGVRVLVPAADESEARKLLNQSDGNQSDRKEPNAFQRWLFSILGGNK